MDDRLNRDERIRLEALNQAVLSSAGTGASTVGSILFVANKFDEYIRGTLDANNVNA